MTFKNLEERYNATVKDLYSGATSKFDGGKPSQGRNDAPLIVRAPGKGYIGSAEKIGGRMLPVSSTIEDVKRLTLFQLSPQGLKFLAKQQLLQTGNTFELTRIINPTFVVANAVPFLHIKRNLRPLKDLVGKTDRSYENVRKMGQLQEETYKLLTRNWKIPSYIERGSVSRSGLFSRLGNAIKNAATNALDTAVSLVNPKRNIGDKVDSWGPGSWKQSRPELAPSGMVETVRQKNIEYQIYVHQQTDKKFIKYFLPGVTNPNEDRYAGGISSLTVGEDENGLVSINRKNSLDIERDRFGQKISYVRDPLNLPAVGTQKPTKILKQYNTLSKLTTEANTDIIRVAIAMGNDDHIQFRAFITDINQTATPDYKQYQYIGRIEKFVSYVGVQREVSFKLGVIAFSKEELRQVWKRINYLTATVYPYNTYKGILQPNLIRLTIGDLYRDQPGYISSLSTNFNQLAESWEIDKDLQVPISAQMDMKFVLIEKNTKTANSSFYGITENPEEDRFSLRTTATRTTVQPPTIRNVIPPIGSAIATRIANAILRRP